MTLPAMRRFATTGYGLNLRMHPLAAALATGSLGRLDEVLRVRQANCDHLDSILAGLPGLRPPVRQGHVTRVAPYSHQPLCRAEELGGLPIETFVRAVQAEGVTIGRPNTPPLHQAPLFQDPEWTTGTYGPGRDARRYRNGELPGSERYFTTALRMPVFPRRAGALRQGRRGDREGGTTRREASRVAPGGGSGGGRATKETRFKIGAYGVCLREGHLLLARYVDPRSGEKWWTLPGGKLEHGEDPVDAVVREVHEETGYEVVVSHLLGVGSRTNDVDWGIPGGAELRSVGVYYAVEVAGGELTNEDQGSTDAALWIPLGEVGVLDRAVLVDIALDLHERRPADGRPYPVPVADRLRH